MPKKKRELLAAPDSAWWHMERADNQMAITAVLTFHGPLDMERLRGLLVEKLLVFPRFRQRVVDPGYLMQPRWVEDESFSLDNHLLRVRLPEPADQEALENLVGNLMSQTLDYRRPLWQFHYVENFEAGSALVARLHHCIADGLALIQVLLGLNDTPCASPVTAVYAGGVAAAAREGVERRRWPRAARVLRGVRLGGGAAASLVHLLFMRFDPPTVLRGPLSTSKKAAWSAPIPLEEVKQIGRWIGGTVNDVVLCMVAGALRIYLEKRGTDPTGLTLRAVVPVNLRRPDQLHSLGNKFGLVFFPLPVGERNAEMRLRTVKANMDRLKRSPEAVVVFGLLNVFGRVAKWMQDLIVALLARKATLVMTNVPGPREPVYFSSLPVRGIMAWVPQSGRLALGVSVLSYNGYVRLGIAADAGLIPEPRMLVEACHLALEELRESAREAPSPPLTTTV